MDTGLGEGSRSEIQGVMQSSRLPGPDVYAGLSTVTLATLMHELLLTRIFSVTMWYHFAFMAISVAMFGMTVGAIIVYLRPGTFTEETARRQLALNALLYALTSVLSFVVYLRIPFIGDGSTKSIGLLALSYVTISVPFVYSGITVTVALTRLRGPVPALYAADLLGAALGCIALIYALEVTDAATAVLVVAAIAALGALLFTIRAPDVKLRYASIALLLLLLFGCTWHHSLAKRNQSPIRIVDTAAQTADAYSYVRWNSHSRVSVAGDPYAASRAVGWGLSAKTGASEAMVNQLFMAIDTWAGTVITRFDGNTLPLAYLKDDVTNVAHHLRPASHVFVVGVGGGRDVLSALVFDQKSVTGVEINPNVLGASTKVYGDFSGHLDRHTKVSLIVDEARSYIARSGKRFDIIQLSLIDTWAATAAGAFVLTENSLYTVEAWQTFIEHLTPRGILTVSRWYYPTRPGEALRITSLARTALVKVGVSDPHQHVVMVKAAKASGLPGELGNGIVTCLVARQPFTALDRVVLESELSRTGFEVVVAPFSGVDSEYGRILAGKDLERFYDTYPLDIRAPTDDKPFFFQMLRIQDFGRSLAENWLDPNRTNLQAIRVLVLLLGIVFVLTTLCVVVPLSIRSRGAGLRGSASFLLFFVAIGLGFMFVEISQMQRLMVFLGRPTYALSVVLFTLLVGSGVGSLICGRWLPNANPRRCMLALAGVVVALALFGVLTPLMIDALGAARTSARVSATAAILFGIGLFLGLPFPLGMHAAKRRAAELTPWLWGINGAASVLCSVLAMIVALSFGITTCFWVGVACYAVAVSAYTMLGKPVTL